MSLKISELWRGLLSPRNQKLLTEILLNEALLVLQFAKESGAFDFNNAYVEVLSSRATELSEAAKLWTLPVYGILMSEPVRLYAIGYEIQKSTSNSTMRAQAISTDTKCQDISGISKILRTHRNRMAHTHDDIDDHGNASILAGAILRLLEISEIRGAWREKCARLREDGYTVLRTVTDGISSDNLSESESQTKKIISDIHALLIDNSKADDPAQQRSLDNKETLGSSGRTLTKDDLTPEFWTSKFQSSIEGIRDQHSLGLKILTDLISNLAHLDRGVEASSKKVELRIDELEHTLSDLLLTRVSNLDGNGTIQTDRKNIAELEVPDEDIDDEDYEDNLTESLEEVSLNPTLTPEQARQRFLGLRKLIKDSLDFSEYIENWQNIFMGPIIDTILNDRVMNTEEFRTNKTISLRYKEHQDIMDEQLAIFGESIEKIMRNVDWPSS
jgi:hypothetical protein